MEAISSTLSFMGALLFLLGLLTGFGIPAFRSPRIGLSAHLDAIESGLGLIAFGLLFLHLRISIGWASLIAHTTVDFACTYCGSAWWSARLTGRAKSLPIAGAGSGRKAMAGECRPDVDFGRLDWLRRRDQALSSPNGAGPLELLRFDRRFWWAVPGSNRRPAD